MQQEVKYAQNPISYSEPSPESRQ